MIGWVHHERRDRIRVASQAKITDYDVRVVLVAEKFSGATLMEQVSGDKS